MHADARHRNDHVRKLSDREQVCEEHVLASASVDHIFVEIDDSKKEHCQRRAIRISSGRA